MIKLLMIQPEKRKISLFRKMIAKFRTQAVLTMTYLAAYADKRYYDVTIVHEYAEDIPYNEKFDLVAITVNTPNAIHCYQISEKFRKLGAKVVMGGPHVTLLPDEAVEHCDHLILQEGEITFPQFLEDFRAGTAKKVYEPNPPQVLENLPKPRWELMRRKMVKYAVFATRGCPYNCSFCALRLVYDKAFRKRPVQDVIEDMKSFPAKFVAFWDDNLFADKAYAKELMSAMIPLKRRWGAMVTLRDCDDDELLALAKKSGCKKLFVGIESFNDDSLAQAKKSINKTFEYESIVAKIHKHGIMIFASFVFGFDGDTMETFDKTVEACEKMGFASIQPHILTPYPKTTLYEQLDAEGRILTKDWNRYNDRYDVVYQPKNMTPDELLQGYMRFIRRIYSLRSIIRRARVSRPKLLPYLIANIGFLPARYRGSK